MTKHQSVDLSPPCVTSEIENNDSSSRNFMLILLLYSFIVKKHHIDAMTTDSILDWIVWFFSNDSWFSWSHAHSTHTQNCFSGVGLNMLIEFDLNSISLYLCGDCCDARKLHNSKKKKRETHRNSLSLKHMIHILRYLNSVRSLFQ